MDFLLLTISIISLIVISLLVIFFVSKKRKTSKTTISKSSNRATKIAQKINTNNNILDELIKNGISQNLSSQIFEDYTKEKDLKQVLQKYLEIEQRSSNSSKKPEVSIVLGINGAGKTTSIAKLSWYFKQKGEKIILGAADTFRAAGSSQLKTWGDKLGIEVITGETGQDPASVAYKATKKALDNSFDKVIIDTSGRLQNNDNLLQELQKIVNVVSKISEVDNVYLVLDSNIGNNSLSQAKNFSKVVKINGIILSKYDSNQKPGVVLDIYNELQIPIKFIGTGEKEDDIQVFDTSSFLNSFL